MEWPIWQTVPAFSEAFDHFKESSKFSNSNSEKSSIGIRCLIVYAIDQDPYFRLARELAVKFGYHKPCSIMCRFLPALEGDAKMSSSTVLSTAPTATTESTTPAVAEVNAPETQKREKPKTIFLTSTPKEIKTMINKAFSGGADTLELHRINGGNPDVDVPYQLLRYFLEDDAELSRLYLGYKDGTISSGEMKKRCIEVITALVESHKQRRAGITDEIMKEYYVF